MRDSSQDVCITFTKWNAVKDLLDLLIKDHEHVRSFLRIHSLKLEKKQQSCAILLWSLPHAGLVFYLPGLPGLAHKLFIVTRPALEFRNKIHDV